MNQPSAKSTDRAGDHDRRWLALLVLLIPASLALLSVTSVNVALPAIRSGVDANVVERSLILTSYALVFALVLLPAGRWGDEYGHKKVFLAGVSIFTIASLWCGVAPDAPQLIAARSLSAIGAGLAMTPVTALIQLLYSGAERTRPFAVMGAVFGAASAAGPIIGGILVEAGGSLGWRLIFLVNVPVGLLALLMALTVLPAVPPRGARGSDPVGVLLFTLALIGLMLPFSLGDGVHVLNAALLGSGIVLLALFVLWERARGRGGHFAIVPLRLFRQRALTIGLATNFLGFAGFTAAFLLLALLWQDALGHGALAAGLLLLPFAVGSIFGAGGSSRLTARIGANVVTLGLALTTLGVAAVGALVLLLESSSLSYLTMLAPVAVAGTGVGLFVGPNINASVAQTEPRDAGVASGLVTAAQRSGTAIGIGLLSALYATLPGGPVDLDVQATAAFVTAAFTALATIVMIASGRARLTL